MTEEDNKKRHKDQSTDYRKPIKYATIQTSIMTTRGINGFANSYDIDEDSYHRLTKALGIEKLV